MSKPPYVTYTYYVNVATKRKMAALERLTLRHPLTIDRARWENRQSSGYVSVNSGVLLLVKSNQWLRNVYLSLLSLVLGINRIGQGLVEYITKYTQKHRHGVHRFYPGVKRWYIMLSYHWFAVRLIWLSAILAWCWCHCGRVSVEAHKAAFLLLF